MRKAIVYGAGSNCRNVLKGLLKSRYEVIGISDMNVQKAGTVIEGYCVISPDKIITMQYDCIVVSIVKQYEEIKKYLCHLGIPEEKVFHFRDVIVLEPMNTGTMKIDWSDLTVNGLYGELCRHIDEISDLEKDFLIGEHNRSFKWLHYFEIYDRHLSKYRGKEVTIMEIGVNKGGSLKLWKNYFGRKAKIIGIDIMPECKLYEEEQIEIYIGNQENRGFWRDMKEKIPKVDILIDDGGHYMKQQIVTFEEMFPHVEDDGIYICEDMGTSYEVKKYKSGYKAPNTMIEYSKNFVDYINAWFSEQEGLEVNEYTRSMHSVHYYTGMVVVEKQIMGAPFDMEICNNDIEKSVVVHMHGREF